MCTTAASAPRCPAASRATQEGKEPACGWGSRRGSGWKGRLAIAQPKSPVAWTEFFPLRGTGAQHSEAAPAGLPTPPCTWMGEEWPARTLTQAAMGPQFQAEVGVSAPCGTPSSGSQLPSTIPSRNLHEAPVLPILGPALLWPKPRKPIQQRKQRPEEQNAETDSPA